MARPSAPITFPNYETIESKNGLLDSQIRDTYSCLSLFEVMFSAAETDLEAEPTTEQMAAHERWMREALRVAFDARAIGEVPVATCVVVGDQLLAAAGNRTRTDCDPTAHAEIVALREASRKTGNYRLANASVYSTIEPCAMCAGALIQARVKLLVYGATDKKAGAVESHFHICDANQLNHRIEVIKGVLEPECRALMQEFFRERRC